LTNLVERHPQFHLKLEGMLKDVFNKLEPEVSATIRKENNEDSCLIYKLANDELMPIFGYIGEIQYGFVACMSDRFRQLYLKTFRNENGPPSKVRWFQCSVQNCALIWKRRNLHKKYLQRQPQEKASWNYCNGGRTLAMS